MTVPTISNLPTVPATSDPNFETEAPALFNHIKNTFVSEMNSAISFINSSTFDATVEFKNANFTAARNFLYMIDTSSGGVSVTLPANPSTGDQLLLMDQKRTFGTNNLTIGRNSQSINGAASDIVSKSTGALIRCIFQSSYGWTVDLYEGEWESGTSAGDLVYNGGNVGIGTSEPDSVLHIASEPNGTNALTLESKDAFLSVNQVANAINFRTNDSSATGITGKIEQISIDGNNDLAIAISTYNGTLNEALRIDENGKVGIGTSAPKSELHIKAKSNRTPTSLAPNELDNNSVFRVGMDTGDSSIYFAYGNAGDAIMQIANSSGGTAQDLFINPFGGKVGIGETNPDAPLHVDSSTGNLVAKFSSSDEDAYISFEDDGTTTPPLVGANDNDLLLWTNNQKRVTIKSDGNVGINTSQPQEKLDLYGNLKLGSSGNDGVIRAWTSRGTTEGGDSTVGSDLILKAGIGTGAGSNGQIEFHTEHSTLNYGPGNPHGSGSAKMVIKSTGNVEVKTGNLVIGTAGKGIDFGVASGSVTSQLLDDYEEGTWSPVVADASSGGNTASGSFSGTYTKIGRVVTVHCYALNINTTGMTSTNSLVIRNLPFQNVGLIAKYGSVRLDSVTFSGYCTTQIGGSASHVSIIENKNGLTNSGLTVGDLTSGVSDIYFGLTYETS